MKLLVVVNANARSGRAAKRFYTLRQTMASRGFEAEYIQAASAAETTRAVARTSLESFDAVISVGGDGTMFRVLNGLMQNPVKRPLGIIPLGTGNAFARDLGLPPDDVDRALDVIAVGRTRPVDVGEACCRNQQFYFLNIIGMGFVVRAGKTAAQLKFAGPVSYSLAALWNTLWLKHEPYRIAIDGVERQFHSVFLEVSNSRYTGTSFLMAPAASIDDGLLDMTLLKRLPRHRLLKLFPTIYSGRHVDFDEVVSEQVRELHIREPEEMPLMADGELIGKTPATIRCLAGAIDLIC